MSDTVTLKHVSNRQPVREIYFYDGLEVARDGLITIPLNQMHRIKRVWKIGYNQSPDGRPLMGWLEVEEEIRRQTAESAKEDNESSDSGRQPNAKDRVRAGKR